MKKLLVVAAVSLGSLAAFAQGKIGFVTDSLHLAEWIGSPFNGQAINSDNLPPGLPGIAAFLYMGTSSSQLFLYSSASFGPLASGPGKWTLLNVQANANPVTGAPAIPSGSVFVDVALLSTEKAAPNTWDTAAFQSFAACEISDKFTFSLGTSITYPVMYGPNNGGSWAPGIWQMDQYGAGSRGAFYPLPEPSPVLLMGLGAGTMLIFVRKSLHRQSAL
jgi:hypothetical protein